MNDPEGLIRMIRDGGVYYNIAGVTPESVFADLAKHLDLPAGVDREAFSVGLLEREKLITTAIGNGIAVPHPRTALVSQEADERVFVCFLDAPADFDSMDGKPVFVLFVILSSCSQRHLKILSSLSWLFQHDTFRALLRTKPDTQELISAIKHLQGANSK
jgi:PTS system nitrogen regulatory IIA component